MACKAALFALRTRLRDRDLAFILMNDESSLMNEGRVIWFNKFAIFFAACRIVMLRAVPQNRVMLMAAS